MLSYIRIVLQLILLTYRWGLRIHRSHDKYHMHKLWRTFMCLIINWLLTLQRSKACLVQKETSYLDTNSFLFFLATILILFALSLAPMTTIDYCDCFVCVTNFGAGIEGVWQWTIKLWQGLHAKTENDSYNRIESGFSKSLIIYA